MDIKTQFKPGDDVLFYDRGKLHNGIVYSINIDVDKQSVPNITYNIINNNKDYLSYGGGNRNFHQNMLFETKNDFIKSL